jgi:hypothetical protein
MKGKLITIAMKSPRLGPLTSHSLIISSMLNRRLYRRPASCAVEPQWKDVCIVRLADMGCPAYKENFSEEDALVNGVDIRRTHAAATILESAKG